MFDWYYIGIATLVFLHVYGNIHTAQLRTHDCMGYFTTKTKIVRLTWLLHDCANSYVFNNIQWEDDKDYLSITPLSSTTFFELYWEG